MEFGNKQTIINIDKEGSTRTKSETYRNSDVITTVVIYDVRKRVTGTKEELSEYIKFRNEYKDNAISFTIEYPKDYKGDWHYIVLRYKDTY